VFGWFTTGQYNLTSPGEPRHVRVVSVTPALVQNLGVTPFAGQWFTDDSGAVLSYGLWRRLGADRGLVGRALTLDGVDLQPGDVLVAFTDGVTEAMNASDEEFGEERLKEILRQVVHLPVNEIAAGISQGLKSWIKDAAQYDDLTFVVMKVS